ncbi:MAG: hypothetical protein ACC628_07360 [Pirellulaceae bacterium]
MTTVADPHRKSPTPGEKRVQLRVSAYDNVASLLISLIILIGMAVGIMFVIWLTNTLVFRQKSVPVTLVENVAGRGDHAEGFERDLEAPGLEEMPELAEPQLEASLEAVTDAVTAVAASMDVLNTDSTVTGKGEGGMGDNRPPGPLGEGDDIIPRWERWEVRWISNSISAYARQLAFFKIEIGAAGGSPNVDYALNLSQPRPSRRTGPPDAEKRLYMTWREGNLQAFDRSLLSRAGVNTNGRLIMQFFPEEVEDRLAWIEMENGGGRSVKEFLRTVFGVRPTRGGEYEFYVFEQRFRPAPP